MGERFELLKEKGFELKIRVPEFKKKIKAAREEKIIKKSGFKKPKLKKNVISKSFRSSFKGFSKSKIIRKRKRINFI